MKFNNPYTHVTVTGLQPNTSYFLRVTAENGVSYLYGPNSNRNAEIQFGTRISGADEAFSLPSFLPSFRFLLSLHEKFLLESGMQSDKFGSFIFIYVIVCLLLSLQLKCCWIKLM